MAFLLFAISYLQNYTANNSNVDKLGDSSIGAIGNAQQRAEPREPLVEEVVPAARPKPRLVKPVEDESSKARIDRKDKSLGDDFDLFSQFPYLAHLKSKYQ